MSNGKKHCMVVHAYYPLGETRVQREAEALRDRGYQVDILCLRLPGEPATETDQGLHIYRLPVRRHKNRGAIVQLWEYLVFLTLAFFKLTALHLRRRYDVVQVHNPPDFLIFAALIPKLSGAALILDIHDLMPEFFLLRFGVDRRSLIARLVFWQERAACRLADHVITVTEHWRQALIERGVPPDRCSVLMNLADPRIFHRPAAAGRPHAPDRFHLIYHGTIPQNYGLDLALQAIAQLRAEIPGLHMTIIGGGGYLPALRRLRRELHLEEVVRFVDFIPAPELPAYIMEADLAVVPYRDDPFTGDLLPTKLMEYALLGVPAVAARTRGIAAYFDETMVCFFRPGAVDELADCIRALYHDRDRLAALAEGIQTFNRRYNWAEQSAAYAQLVARLGSGQTEGEAR